ncbi:MAG: protoheme IX farnesyltransferase [Gammaproteobacteria bacterium]|nr:protoheme IX farnesyltransferase [Gammaproteobacteria bacterium]
MMLRAFIILTKPKVLMLMMLTTFAGIILAPTPYPSTITILLIIFGQACIAGSGAVLNHIFDRVADAKMSRTNQRPLVKKSVPINHAYLFALALWIVGSILTLISANQLTWLLTTAGAIGYAVIYTCFLKTATPQNIALGGLSGAIPPLLGWVACTNSIDPGALLLSAIIFAWTPAHFWALSIGKKSDYEKANIPMLPVTHGIKITSYFIISYTILLIPLCLLVWLTGMCSIVYAILSCALNIWYLYINLKLVYEPEKYAMRSFYLSISYLYLLFFIMISDHLYRRFL